MNGRLVKILNPIFTRVFQSVLMPIIVKQEA